MLQLLCLTREFFAGSCQLFAGTCVLLGCFGELSHSTANLHHGLTLFTAGSSDFLHQLGGLLNAGDDCIQQFSSTLCGHYAIAGQLPDLFGSLLAALGQLADFGCDHCKAFAMLACTSRLNGGIEGQQIRLVGNVIHDPDFGCNLLHGRDSLTYCSPSLSSFNAGFCGHAVSDFGVITVLGNAGRHDINL